MQCNVDFDCECYDIPCLCQLNSLIKIIGYKWSTEILTTIGYFDGIHFTDIQNHVINISPNVLTERLYQLEEFGLIEKKIIPLLHKRITYHLTSKGRNVWYQLIKLIKVLK